MKTKKENSKNLPKNDDGTDLRRLPLIQNACLIRALRPILDVGAAHPCCFPNCAAEISNHWSKSMKKRADSVQATCSRPLLSFNHFL